MTYSRRGFISVLAATSACSVASSAIAAPAKGKIDKDLSVFISDVHLNGRNKPDHIFVQYADKAFKAILKMKPLPANVLILGDLSEGCGMPIDYEKIADFIKPLQDLGIKVTMGMGNHDNRENFLKQFPEYEKSTLVQGSIVSKVSIGHADIVLLDSLKMGSGSGFITDEQKAWVTENAPKWTRPTFIASHHPANETFMKGMNFSAFLCSIPNLTGFIHGHQHIWNPGWVFGRWGAKPIVRTLGIPSTSNFGDNGWTTVRTTPKGMIVSLFQHDFCWTRPLPENEKPTTWKDIIANHQNQTCTFSW